jgi:hypothetical protein
VLDLARLQKASSEEEFEDGPEYFMGLSMVRDPFTIRRYPTLIFNAAFGRSPANISFVIGGGARPVQGDWDEVEMTEAEIESRCLPFDEMTMAAFRQGQPVLWVWDPLVELPTGRQEQSRLTNAMRDALAARTQKAITLIGVMRNRDEPRRLNPDRATNVEYFWEMYMSKVLGRDVKESGEYDRSSIPFFDIKGSCFERMYGFPVNQFRYNLKEELPFFDHFYGNKQRRARFDEYEIFTLEVLYRGYQRAVALEVAQHENRQNLKEYKRSYRSQLSAMNGQAETFELTSYEYFLIALHSGFNPQQLHPGLARCHHHLGAAAWLGRLGHGHSLPLPFELCEPLLELLDGDAPHLCDDGVEDADIRDLLRRHAELFAGIRQLSTMAKQVLESGQASVVRRRVHGRITGGQRKGELLEFMPETIPSDIVTRALMAADRAAGDLKLRIGDEEIVVRPFLPLAW